MELIPVKENIEDNKEFTDNPLCKDSIYMSVDYFKKIGYNYPWIGYYIRYNGEFVACAAFKGKPVNGRIEIAYGVFEHKQNGGIGAMIPPLLIALALKTDPFVIVTAKTLAEENFSTRILRKNNFKLMGEIMNNEDGLLWDWEYQPN